MKSLDAHEQYWLDCIECSLDEYENLNDGPPLCITKEFKEQLARDIQRGHENKSMMFGYDCIPNPDKLEIKRLEKRIEEEKENAEEWQSAFRKNVSLRRGHPVSQISVDKDGSAEIQP